MHAYGIGNQVAGSVEFLSNALTTAINPQIIKAEGAGDRQKMFRLAEISCKFSFLLMSMISVPAFIFMDKLLAIWLRKFLIIQRCFVGCFFWLFRLIC